MIKESFILIFLIFALFFSHFLWTFVKEKLGEGGGENINDMTNMRERETKLQCIDR